VGGGTRQSSGGEKKRGACGVERKGGGRSLEGKIEGGGDEKAPPAMGASTWNESINAAAREEMLSVKGENALFGKDRKTGNDQKPIVENKKKGFQ